VKPSIYKAISNTFPHIYILLVLPFTKTKPLLISLTLVTHIYMRGMDIKFNKIDESAKLNELRKGPWTLEEDTILVNYISTHGEGHWNTVACSAGIYDFF
jgi:hypothetical protein